MSNRILLREGENVTYTIYLKKKGSGDPLVYTGGTPVLYLHDDDDAVALATNIVTAGTVTQVDPANGIISFLFTSTHTALAAGKGEMKGHTSVKVTQANGEIEWGDDIPTIIRRNQYAT